MAKGKQLNLLLPGPSLHQSKKAKRPHPLYPLKEQEKAVAGRIKKNYKPPGAIKALKKKYRKQRISHYTIIVIISAGLGLSLNLKSIYDLTAPWKIAISVIAVVLIIILIWQYAKQTSTSVFIEHQLQEASEIWNLTLLSGKPSPKPVFTKIRQTWQINEDQSTDYKEELTIKPTEGDLEVYAKTFKAWKEADPIPSFKDHGITTTVDGTGVYPIVLDVTNRDKAVAIIFPRPIEKGRPAKIFYKFNWPNYWKPLFKKRGFDEIEWKSKFECLDLGLELIFPPFITSKDQVEVTVYPNKYKESGSFTTTVSGIDKLQSYEFKRKNLTAREELLIRFNFVNIF